MTFSELRKRLTPKKGSAILAFVVAGFVELALHLGRGLLSALFVIVTVVLVIAAVIGVMVLVQNLAQFFS